MGYVGMQPPAGAKLPVKFGWGWSGHTAIEKGGINLLPDSPWKGWLKDNADLINDHSIRQDKCHSGPDHFINLETMDTPGAELPDSERTYAGVSKAFSAHRKQAKADEFARSPLDPQVVDGHQNVLAAVTGYYTLLVEALKDIAANPPRRPIEVTWQNIRLHALVGALAHYIGDLHQPMHNTAYHTWELAHPWSFKARGETISNDDAHAFFERELFRPDDGRGREDYHKWHNALYASGYQPKADTLTSFRERLTRMIETGYLRVFDLVAKDRRAREKARSPENYHQRLRRSWKAGAEKYMAEAARTMSDMLLSAWRDAGKPDLGGLKQS